MGRINSINNGNPITYEYDAYNQLVRENDKALDKTIQYVYNNIGNIESVTTTNSSVVASTQVFTYGDGAHPDRLTRVGTTDITYDSTGRPTAYGVRTMYWIRRTLADQICKRFHDFEYTKGRV